MIASEQDKLEQLLEVKGYDDDLDSFIDDMDISQGTVGICMNEGCEYTELLDPGEIESYCPNCEEYSVRSGWALAGLPTGDDNE